MKQPFSILACMLSVPLFACSSDSESNVHKERTVDASPKGSTTADASPAKSNSLPVWMLEDIQPMSDKFGETYGLNAFPQKTLVVVLVEGF